jgi:hypothetical protein
MSDHKCSFCPRTFSTINGLSKHMISCSKKIAEDNIPDISISSAQVQTISKPIKSIKQKQKVNVDLNEYYTNSEFSAKTMSFNDIKFRKVAKKSKTKQIISNNDLDSTYAGPSVVSNTDYISDELTNMPDEIEESYNDSLYTDLVTPSVMLDELEPTLPQNREFSNDFLNNPTYSDDIQASLSDDEFVQYHDEFPIKLMLI